MKSSSLCRALLFSVLPFTHLFSEEREEMVQEDVLISREHPNFVGDGYPYSDLSVGRDGKVYFRNSKRNPLGGWENALTRLNLDGSGKVSQEMSHNAANATANTEGVVATAAGHYRHAINLHTPDLELYAFNDDFLVGDKSGGWSSPRKVRAGASGDFYGLDTYRDRIVRIDSQGRITGDFALPEGAAAEDFHVSEAEKLFVVRGAKGLLQGIGFDGEVRWSHTIPGIFFFAAGTDGTVYLMDYLGREVRRIAADGGELPPLQLEMGDSAPVREHILAGLAVHDGVLVLRRNHPTELFQVYELDTGARRNVVEADHARLQATFPGRIWTAGEEVPFRLDYRGAGAPFWRVWATTLGDNDWRQLEWKDGRVSVPENFGGLYQIKVSDGLTGSTESERMLRTVVEVRTPDSRGTVSVWSPSNRAGFARGEEIPLTYVLRGPEAVGVRLVLRGPDGWEREIASGTLQPNRPEQAVIPAGETAALAPGRYVVVPVAERCTGAGQPIRLGGPLENVSPFLNTVYGDYRNSNSIAGFLDFPDDVQQKFDRARILGVNQFINRTFVGRYPLHFLGSRKFAEDLWKRQEGEKFGTAPEKTGFGFSQLHALGLSGGAGIREMLILMTMDAGLPIGTGHDPREPAEFREEIQKYSKELKGLPAFHGWAWTANWWVYDERGNRRGEVEGREAYQEARKHAMETGEWNPILDAVGDRILGLPVKAQAFFDEALKEVSPRMATATAGPFRRPEVYPPFSFSNVDEVDLHFQSEQIAPPNWTAQAVDYYKRPNKPAWLHPEIKDDGTGLRIFSLAWPAVMRGTDGFGMSEYPRSHGMREDARSGQLGIFSIWRALNGWLLRHGPWFDRLEKRDPVAILVSKRQVKLDDWGSGGGGIGGRYFSRLFEAFNAFLHAGYPATYLYAEDVGPDTFSRIKGLVLVSQEVDLEPELREVIDQARRRAIPILTDGNCRDAVVPGAIPLGVAFDRLDRVKMMNHDPLFWEFPEAVLAHVTPLREVLAQHLPTPPVKVNHPEVIFSERVAKDARVLWVVNNAHQPMAAEKLWRVSAALPLRAPVEAEIEFAARPGEAVYEVFSGRLVHDPSDRAENVVLKEYLPGGHARLYVFLPGKIEAVTLGLSGPVRPGEPFSWRAQVPGINGPLPLQVSLIDGEGRTIEERITVTGEGQMTAPQNAPPPFSVKVVELISGKTASAGAESRARETVRPGNPFDGPRLRDLAVARDGSTALMNAFSWGANLFTIDVQSGALIATGRVGDFYAFAPLAVDGGYFVQGYDLSSPEGYHLYAVGPDGKPQRRFALPGRPGRLMHWAGSWINEHPASDFVSPPGGGWLAGGGNLAVAVWSAAGDPLWVMDWSEETRKKVTILALDDRTLVVGDGRRVTAFPVDPHGAFRASPPEPLWSVPMPGLGRVQELAAAPDGGLIAVRSDAEGGRIFLCRGGEVEAAIPIQADSVSVAPDGSRIAALSGNRLSLFAGDGGPLANFAGDDRLVSTKFSPDGKMLAASSVLGTVYLVELDRVADAPAESVRTLDMGGLCALAWLPGGDLLLASWLGDVARIGKDGSERWRVHLNDKPPAHEPGEPETIRWTGGLTHGTGNRSREDNLLDPQSVSIVGRAMSGKNSKHAERVVELGVDPVKLVDGDRSPPGRPWLDRGDLGYVDSGWRGPFVLEFDTRGRRVRLEAITFVEDPDHPESWLSDARLEYWDAEKKAWELAQFLTADAAEHTHELRRPVEASRFRLAAADPNPIGWPAGNLRLAEIVFHGEWLGGTHRDVIAKRPVAVLYDEGELRGLNAAAPAGGYETSGASSGTMSVRTEGGHPMASSQENSPFGRGFPGWEFEIAEKPVPGQYRYLQFDVRALSPETRAVGLRVGPGWPFLGVLVQVGDPEGRLLDRGVATTVKAGDLGEEWKTVRVDLWEALRAWPRFDPAKDRIRDMVLVSQGGAAGFDRILLGRTEEDLDAALEDSIQ